MNTIPIWNVPNAITLGRLVLAVLVLILVAQAWYFSALVAFGLAASTDALDGYAARRLNQCTPLGRQLDPLVDKVVVSGAFIYLLAIPDTGLAPWMVTVVVVRELLIQGLRSHLEGQGTAFGAQWAGKLKTVFQCLSISAILACLAAKTAPTLATLGRDVLTWSAIALTLYSGLGYVAVALPRLRGDVAGAK